MPFRNLNISLSVSSNDSSGSGAKNDDCCSASRPITVEIVSDPFSNFSSRSEGHLLKKSIKTHIPNKF